MAKVDVDKSFETLDVLFDLAYGDGEPGGEKSARVPSAETVILDGCDICLNIPTWRDIVETNQDRLKDCLVQFKRGAYRIFSVCDEGHYNRTLTIETNFCPKCGRKLNNI